MKQRHLVFAAVLTAVGLLAAQASEAQPFPLNTKYISCSFQEKAGNSIVGFDENGIITTIKPLNNATQPGSIAMNPTNDAILVWDRVPNCVHMVNPITGVQITNPLTGRSLRWGAVDEDCGMVWCGDYGQVYKSQDMTGKITTLLANLPRSLVSVCWNGSTGGYVVARAGTSNNDSQLFFLSRDGKVVRTVIGITYMSGLDWCPWTGDILVSHFQFDNGAVVRVDQKGRATTVTVTSTATSINNSIEVMEQPRERYLCSELGSDPQHLTSIKPSGAITTIHASSGKFGPADADLLGHRPLWATNRWVAGSVGKLSLNFGPKHAGEFYVVLLSFDHKPGIDLSPHGTLHLGWSWLLFQTLYFSAPPIFNYFHGVLDSSGRATPPPYMHLPIEARDYRIYGGALAYNYFGITALSNCWGTTIQ